MLRYERKAYQDGAKLVAGVDEAGRGPLAGPVLAAAVVLPREFHHNTLTDSKLLTARQRDRIFAELTDNPDVFWAVGISEVEVIDRIFCLLKRLDGFELRREIIFPTAQRDRNDMPHKADDDELRALQFDL